ncbi:MAG: hypothetical protein ACJAQU_002472, partial [Loktanella salsilacus]
RSFVACGFHFVSQFAHEEISCFGRGLASIIAALPVC